VAVLRALLRAATGLITLALVLDQAPNARADSPTPTPTPTPTAPPPTTTPKRELPDYDGRGEEPTTPGDVALWVPRILVSPIYLVTEYGLRRPIGAVVSAAERAGLPAAIYDFFTFGPDHKAGFAPTFLVDFGFVPSVGIYAFWDDAIFKNNDLRLHASTFGPDWLAGSLTDRIHLTKNQTLSFHVSAIRRPDHAFFGIGPQTLQSNISRYGEDSFEGGALVDARLWRGSHIEAGTGVRSVSLYEGHYFSDPSLGTEASVGAYPIPYDFGRGYTAQYNHLAAALDTRVPRPASGSGFRLEMQADQGSDIRATPDSGWIRYGGAVGGFWDVTRGRVVSFSVATSFVDSLGGAPIPFTELVALGGDGPMRGFMPGRLLGQSSVVGTVRYTWPIWVWLDGALEVATGNVFGDHLEDFKPSLLRLSGALGIESISTPDNAFEFLVGFGTETFEQGGQVDSVRVLVGTNHGF
jgi:hypothetical protein